MQYVGLTQSPTTQSSITQISTTQSSSTYSSSTYVLVDDLLSGDSIVIRSFRNILEKFGADPNSVDQFISNVQEISSFRDDIANGFNQMKALFSNINHDSIVRNNVGEVINLQFFIAMIVIGFAGGWIFGILTVYGAVKCRLVICSSPVVDNSVPVIITHSTPTIGQVLGSGVKGCRPVSPAEAVRNRAVSREVRRVNSLSSV